MLRLARLSYFITASGLIITASLILLTERPLLGSSRSGPEMILQRLRSKTPTLISARVSGDHCFFPGDYSRSGIIGIQLPGAWRPFSTSSPWNLPILKNARKHPDSDVIMYNVISHADHIRFANSYLVPVWVVNSDNLPAIRVKSKYAFDWWDRDRDGWTDIGVPVTIDMWAEPTPDGHISIIDPFKKLAWEMSRFYWQKEKFPHSSTFNIWDITGYGVGDAKEGKRWKARGGRGSGFPLIAGLIRPEEISAGEIRHAMVFTFRKNREADDGSKIFLNPASRSDGRFKGRQNPIEGMRFQLDPALSENDFNSWGLDNSAKIIARALQKYGMFLGDNGGDMALQVQLLASTPEMNLQCWEYLFPGLYKNIERIPTDKFRVIYTGEPIIKK